MAQDDLRMGVAGRPHGVKGELSASWDGETLPGPGEWLEFRRGPEAVRRKLESARPHKGRILLTLAGVQDRAAAAALNGSDIYMSRSSLPPPAEDEAWLADMPGFRVLLADGSYLGLLDHLEFPAGQEIWAIMPDNGPEILFPARPEFIAGINSQAREVRIDPPPGLLDIYRA